ncbi:hypothetical protein CKALI_05125 [Corynebacterium kalinowskii]|uniref:Uncharacterized protein n=1 Tax=Corynebacterium kalinowskii TaxID=2675216 RepID=A0A6B8VFX9_9CORY|nr:hypothetical protein [Corynebacterium kalinowskii]QGU01899.1 hypothetical protein CKALI_05125 [Corynebacterium kalinowskii]
MFAHGFATDRLNQEKTTMPSGQAITSLKSQESQDALKPFEGQPMTTGPQAKVYSDHFIWDHMMASSDGKTYQEMGDVIKKAKADGKSEDEIKKMNETRDSLFKGDALRGILLNAYGWWLVGTIAIWAGAALLALAAILLALGFTVLRTKK